MGLFDLISEDKTATDNSGTTATSQTSNTDSGDFLIITDTTPAAAPVIEETPAISANDIPDSAISFFEEKPADSLILDSNAEPLSSDIISFDSEEIAPVSVNEESSSLLMFTEDKIEEPAQAEVSLSDSLSFSFDSEEITPVSVNEESSNPLVFSEEVEVIDEPETETSVLAIDTSINLESSAQEEVAEPIQEEIVAPQDPKAILEKAIADFETLLSGHSSRRESEMTSVEQINKQIASLKEEAKSHTEEAKRIGEEEVKVQKMIDMFKQQKI